MKPIVLFSVLLLGCSQSKKTEYGSVTVNAFWEYNKYVGNRPDANSDVRLFALFDSTIRFNGNTDVTGNATFDSIPAGEYLIIVESDATTTEARSAFRELYGYRREIIKLFKVNEELLSRSREDTLARLDSLATHNLINTTDNLASLNRYEKLKDSAINVAGRWMYEFPDPLLLEAGISLSKYPSKFEIRRVTVKSNRKEAVVIDFGNTYL